MNNRLKLQVGDHVAISGDAVGDTCGTIIKIDVGAGPHVVYKVAWDDWPGQGWYTRNSLQLMRPRGELFVTWNGK